jgi:hypothetical protein
MIGDAKKGKTELAYGEVIAVDRIKSTCDVRVLGLSKSTLRKVPYCVPYASPYGGGLDFMPEVGAQCLVATSLSSPSSGEDLQNLIVGFRTGRGADGGYANEDRPEMGEGDVFVSSGALNRVELRSDGVTRLLAHEACVTEYTPESSKIEHICAEYFVTTPSGYLRWGGEQGSTGGPSSLTLRVRGEQSEELGQGDVLGVDVDASGVQVNVFGDGADPLAGAGNLTVSATPRGSLSISSREAVSVRSDRNAEVVSGAVQIQAATSLSLSVGPTRIELTEAGVRIYAKSIEIITDDMNVTSQTGEPQSLLRCARESAYDTDNKQLLTEDLLPWIFNHVHANNGTPPVGASLISPQEEGERSSSVSISSSQAAQSAELSEPDDLTSFIELVSAGLATQAAPLTGPALSAILSAALSGINSISSARKASALSKLGVVGGYADVLTQQTKVR